MINPVSFETAWAEAERRAYEMLVASAGSADGRDAYLGRNPGVANAWHFESVPVQKSGDNALLAPDVHTVYIPYRAECVFLKRERCMGWAMRIIGGLPLTQDTESNVAAFRVASLGDVVPGIIQLANEKSPVDVWRLEMTFDLVFITGGRSNMASAAAG